MRNIMTLLVLMSTIALGSPQRLFNELVKIEGIELTHDVNGLSKFGMTVEQVKSYNTITRKKLRIETLTYSQCLDIYDTLYYKGMRIGEIKDNRARIHINDFVYNSFNGVKVIQDTLREFGYNLESDNVIGSKTILAINSMGNSEVFLKRLKKKRLCYLKALKIWKKYGKGWKRRVDELKI